MFLTPSISPFSTAACASAVAFNFRASYRGYWRGRVAFPPRFAPLSLSLLPLSPIPLSTRKCLCSTRKGRGGHACSPRFAWDIAEIMAILIFRGAARFHRGCKNVSPPPPAASSPSNILRDNASCTARLLAPASLLLFHSRLIIDYPSLRSKVFISFVSRFAANYIILYEKFR